MENNDPLIGKIVAEKYQVIELIGSGGQGSVYKARHLRLNKIIALKILRSDYMDDPKIASRFHHEAQIASQLEHPNIVRAVDHGKCPESNVVYIEMDYVDGVPLKNLLQPPKESPYSIPRLEVERSINIVIQLCDAIYYAHKKKGVIHRDIKPGNILLTNYNNNPDFVKITDFGIAKVLIESDELKKLTKTEMGNLEGTCLYMAPEQFKEGYNPDFPLDIYSIGCILFELLTGGLPFKGASDLATINMHINADIPVLILDSVEPVIKSRFTDIVSKALAKDPAMRYQNAKDLQLDLEKLQLRVKELSLHEASIISSTAELAWLFLLRTSRNFKSLFKRSNAYILVSAIIILIVLSTAAIMIFQNKYAGDFVLPKDQRNIEWKPSPPAETVTDQHIFEEKEKQFFEVLGTYRTFGKLSTAEGLPLLRKFGYFYLKSQSLTKAFQQFYKAQQLIIAKNIDEPDEEINVYLGLSECSFAMGAYPECIKYAEKALEIINKRKEQTDYRTFASNSIGALEFLGRAAVANKNTKTAETAFLRMYDISKNQEFFTIEPERHATSFYYAGCYFLEAQHLDIAEVFFKYAIQGWNRCGNSLNEAVSWNQLGLVLMKMQKYNEAIAAFKNSETIMLKNPNPSLKNLAKIVFNRADAEQFAGDKSAAQNSRMQARIYWFK